MDTHILRQAQDYTQKEEHFLRILCWLHRFPKLLRRGAAGLATIATLLNGTVGDAIAASSWKPTLLVNTEAFQVIDDTDSVANPELRFGDSIVQRIIYDRSNSRFHFSKSVYISGSITATGSLKVLGSLSGASLTLDRALSASGSITTEQTVSGATIGGFGLRDCDTATTSKLLWDTATGKFSCGTDQSGGGGSNPPWAGILHGALADGNSIYVARSMEVLNTVAGPTPTNIGTTVARCVGYRSAYAITVNRVRLLGVGATTSLYKFAVYPRGTGAARLWESGTVTSAANTWLSISANTPFTLSANTDYWFCVTVATTGSTTGFRSPPAPINTGEYSADNSPLGGRGIGLPVYVQFAVTSGAFPVTLPAVAAAAYGGGSTGSVPFAFFDNTSP